MSIAQRGSGIVSLPRWAFVPLRDTYIALALFCTASSALAVAQAAFGWYPFPVWVAGQTPGLLFNPINQGESLALMIVALYVNRLRWFIPALLPGLYLAHSRGGWAVLVTGLIATRVRHPLWLIAGALALGLVYATHPNSSDLQRLEIWRAAWTHLALFGNGPGSFYSLYMGPPDHVIHPEYVHNDYLQAVFEYGVLALIPFAVIVAGVARTAARDWPTLVAFLFAACFSMPVHMPVVATLGAIALATTILETPNA